MWAQKDTAGGSSGDIWGPRMVEGPAPGQPGPQPTSAGGLVGGRFTLSWGPTVRLSRALLVPLWASAGLSPETTGWGGGTQPGNRLIQGGPSFGRGHPETPGPEHLSCNVPRTSSRIVSQTQDYGLVLMTWGPLRVGAREGLGRSPGEGGLAWVGWETPCTPGKMEAWRPG